MKPKTRILLVSIFAFICALGALSLRTRSGREGQIGAERVTRVEHDRTPNIEPLTKLEPRLVKAVEASSSFKSFLGSTLLFSMDEAAKVGLTKEEAIAVEVCAFKAWNQFIMEVASQARIDHLGPKESMVVYRLDDVTSDRLKSDFEKDVRSEIGEQKWAAVQSAGLLKNINATSFDYWGKYATTYHITTRRDPQVDLERVTVDVVTDQDMRFTRNKGYIANTFTVLYGPLAAKLF